MGAVKPPRVHHVGPVSVPKSQAAHWVAALILPHFNDSKSGNNTLGLGRINGTLEGRALIQVVIVVQRHRTRHSNLVGTDHGPPHFLGQLVLRLEQPCDARCAHSKGKFDGLRENPQLHHALLEQGGLSSRRVRLVPPRGQRAQVPIQLRQGGGSTQFQARLSARNSASTPHDVYSLRPISRCG
jgi:hypothetical protein